MLIVICGLPGVGKTTIAKKITERLGAQLLKTNDIRKELFPSPQYTDEEFQTVYDELFTRAKQIVNDGHNLVLDGTFMKQVNRDRARALTRDAGVEYTLVLVTCDDAIVQQRIEDRARHDPDGAPYWAYEQFKKILEPVTGPELTIDNSGARDATDERLQRIFKQNS